MTARAIPNGYHSLTPGMLVHGAKEAIEFYERAFGAETKLFIANSDGSLAHAELQIGNSRFMIGEASAAPVQTLRVMLYCEDADAMFARAVEAGATVKIAMADLFYGDRNGHVVDPYGNEWIVATHTLDLPQDEIMRRAKAALP
jgi:PhnB protein